MVCENSPSCAFKATSHASSKQSPLFSSSVNKAFFLPSNTNKQAHLPLNSHSSQYTNIHPQFKQQPWYTDPHVTQTTRTGAQANPKMTKRAWKRVRAESQRSQRSQLKRLSPLALIAPMRTPCRPPTHLIQTRMQEVPVSPWSPPPEAHCLLPLPKHQSLNSLKAAAQRDTRMIEKTNFEGQRKSHFNSEKPTTTPATPESMEQAKRKVCFLSVVDESHMLI